ncbi:MAG: NADH:quinone oxidoreductase [Paracoccaceae bacterium]
MDQISAMSECKRKWWQYSIIAGAVIAVLLWLMVYGFFTSLVIGIVIAVVAGLVLSNIKCTSVVETPMVKSSVMSQEALSSTTTAEAPKPAAAPETTATPDAAATAVEPDVQAETRETKPKAAPAKKTVAKRPPATKASSKAAPAKAPVSADGKPAMLTEARVGGADNLKLLKGVGPKLEATLNDLGVFHFDQIAGWRKKEIAWVDERLKFKGRIERDDWIKQAKVLAKGGETEFSKRSKKS